MKNNKFLNPVDDIRNSRDLRMQNIFSKITTEEVSVSERDISSNISAAILGKNVVKVKDEDEERIMGITDDKIIEFDEKIIKGVTMATQGILKQFKERVEKGIVLYPNVMETLTHIECTNAAFIDTPEFIEVKKELNKILVEMLESDNLEYIEIAREGILDFFESSKNNIVRGRKKFKNLSYQLQNSEEKEFLRAIFISEMVEDGVIDFNFLEMAGELDEMDFDTIDGIYRKDKLFSPEEVEQALLISELFHSREEILEYYIKEDKKYFLNFATSEEIAQYVINGKISSREAIKKIKIDEIKEFSPELLEEFLCVSNFPKGVKFIKYIQNGSRTEKALSKEILSSLDRERFLKVVLSEKVEQKYSNPYTSGDYINEYGKLTIEDMMRFEQSGKIVSEDLIKLTTFKSMQVQEPEEYSKMVSTLLDYYDLDKLEEILKNQKSNKKFVELYNDLLENMATEDQRKLYFEKISKDLNVNENSDEVVVLMTQTGLNVGDKIEYEISEDYIAEQFLEEKISENDLMEFYQKGLISLQTIRILYSDPNLIDKFRTGKIDYRVLNILENRADIIKTELQSGRLTMKQLMDLYSKQDGIVMDEFIEITKGYEFEDKTLVDFLSDEITSEKVQALFNNYYISQDDLSVLVARNIVTKEQAKNFAEKIATHEEYESIFSLDNSFVVLTKGTDGEFGDRRRHPSSDSIGQVTKRASQIKNDPELQEFLLSQIGFDERTLILQGTNNSLNGYKVYPSEEHGIMVFLKNDKPGNATYIMSVQQGMFFLNKIVRERINKTGEKEVGIELQSDATKNEIRETEHIKVKNASEKWGTHFVKAMEQLSPSFKEKMRKPSEYRKIIEDVTEEIKKDYRDRKERNK